MKNRYQAVAILTILLLIGALISAGFADGWRAEFDDICSKVQVADTLSTEELQTLVKRVDELIPQVKASGDSHSKVFIFRLNKCKDMFNFILDTRKK